MGKGRFVQWNQDQLIYRIHATRCGSAEFNASGTGDARFSPLFDPAGAAILTLYGATTFRAAAMETIFHDPPDDIDHHIFSFRRLDLLSVSVIAPARDLVLLDLSTVGLRPLNLKKTQVIETSVMHYPVTRQYAFSWHQEYATIDGLYWTSRQDDLAQACVLFGDRVRPTGLRTVSDKLSLLRPAHLDQVVQLARNLGITQARHFPSGVVGF